MCNLFSMTSNKDAIRQMFGVVVDNTGNMPPQPGIYPNYMAAIVRNTASGRELAMAKWGMPTPPKYLAGKNYDDGETNIRNLKSPHWRRGAAGGIVGAMTSSGVDVEIAHVYAESIRRGSSLVTARVAEDRRLEVEKILDGHNPVDGSLRGNEFRRQGWTRFDDASL